MSAPAFEAETNGALAQLGEHLLCKQGVIGSIPIGSTSLRRSRGFGWRAISFGRHRLLNQDFPGMKTIVSRCFGSEDVGRLAPL